MDRKPLGSASTQPWKGTCFLLILCLTHAPVTVVKAQASRAAPAPPTSLTTSPGVAARAGTADVFATAAAAVVVHVSSAKSTHLLEWWAAFLLVVGALGVVAAVVLPIYHFCKNRAFKKEETARGAEIKKSMHEMTTRLYRTRQQQQQYERGFIFSAIPIHAIEVYAGESSAVKPAGKKVAVPRLNENAIGLARSPTRSPAAVSAVRHRTHSNEPSTPPSTQLISPTTPPQTQAGGGAAGAKRKRSALTRADLQRVDQPSHTGGSGDGVVLSRATSSHSIASSSASSSLLHRNASAATLAVRSTSSRSLHHTPASGQLTRAPSVRAFAGMNRVEALRRALGGPQLHPVPSMHVAAGTGGGTSTHSSPGLRRLNSVNFSSPAVSGHTRSHDSRGSFRRTGFQEPGSPQGHADTVVRSDSSTTETEGTAAEFVETAVPQPLSHYTFLQVAESSASADVTDGSATLNDGGVHEEDDGRPAALARRRLTMDRMAQEMQRLLKQRSSSDHAESQPPVTTAPENRKDSADSTNPLMPPPPQPPEEVPLHRDDDKGNDAVSNAFQQEEDDSEPQQSSASSRFVLTRHNSGAGGEGLRTSGRPFTVRTFHERNSGVLLSSLDDDVAAGEKGSGDVKATEQHILSKSRSAHSYLNPDDAGLPRVLQAVRYSASVNTVSESEEYSKLMDTQFQEDLDALPKKL